MVWEGLARRNFAYGMLKIIEPRMSSCVLMLIDKTLLTTHTATGEFSGSMPALAKTPNSGSLSLVKPQGKGQVLQLGNTGYLNALNPGFSY